MKLRAAVISLPLLACNNDVETNTASVASPVGFAVCNVVEQHGGAADFTFSQEAMPPGLGGKLLDGTYALSDVLIYGPEDFAGGSWGKATFVLFENELQMVSENAHGEVERSNAHVDVDRGTMFMNSTCGAPKSERVGFTASDSHLWLYVHRDEGRDMRLAFEMVR